MLSCGASGSGVSGWLAASPPCTPTNWSPPISDVQPDLAVINLQSEPMPDLPVAEFGDSSMLRVGERVIAIGNAGGSDWLQYIRPWT